MKKLAIVMATAALALGVTGCQNWSGKNDRCCKSSHKCCKSRSNKCCKSHMCGRGNCRKMCCSHNH